MSRLLLILLMCSAAVAQVRGRVSMSDDSTPRAVRNDVAQPRSEITTLRYFRIKKGTFDQFLKASQEGVWPYFEKIGSRVIGMWQVFEPEGVEGGNRQPKDYDEVYLATRYASVEHWAATRDAVSMGGNGPDWEKCRQALALRQSLTISSHVVFLKGTTNSGWPYYMPGLKETFEKRPLKNGRPLRIPVLLPRPAFERQHAGMQDAQGSEVYKDALFFHPVAHSGDIGTGEEADQNPRQPADSDRAIQNAAQDGGGFGAVAPVSGEVHLGSGQAFRLFERHFDELANVVDGDPPCLHAFAPDEFQLSGGDCFPALRKQQVLHESSGTEDGVAQAALANRALNFALAPEVWNRGSSRTHRRAVDKVLHYRPACGFEDIQSHRHLAIRIAFHKRLHAEYAISSAHGLFQRVEVLLISLHRLYSRG
jgi:hypothetical protein